MPTLRLEYPSREPSPMAASSSGPSWTLHIRSGLHSGKEAVAPISLHHWNPTRAFRGTSSDVQVDDQHLGRSLASYCPVANAHSRYLSRAHMSLLQFDHVLGVNLSHDVHLVTRRRSDLVPSRSYHTVPRARSVSPRNACRCRLCPRIFQRRRMIPYRVSERECEQSTDPARWQSWNVWALGSVNVAVVM